MIKEICYEFVLFSARFLLGGGKSDGFFDENKIYEKKSWLNWDVYSRH